MLHDAVYEFAYTGDNFLQLFIQSGITEQIENGNPKYISGKSGLELLCDVTEITSSKSIDTAVIEVYERSDAFWAGYILTYYQCYSKKSRITQDQLAEFSSVPVSTIRAYERKAKDLNKTQSDIVVRLANGLNCRIEDIVGRL